MASEIENKLQKEIDNLKREVTLLRGINDEGLPTFQYSKIKDSDLKSLVTIEKNIKDITQFDQWFNHDRSMDSALEEFLETLIAENASLIDSYSEEDLKINVLAPLISRVKFKSFENEFRGFYELPLLYKSDRFIFNGTVDFVVSQGLVDSKKPYFFIQEFKRSEDYGNPRPQLLAELISAVELNIWTTIKGAYVIGSHWYFVILEKLEKDTYQYFVSKNFDATRLDDLIDIYKNLLYVKKEIITMLSSDV